MHSLDKGWRFMLDGKGASSHSTPGGSCESAWCKERFDDSSWRTVNLPHDFVVEGNFTQTADMAHGYLPYGVGLYRKVISIPSEDNKEELALQLASGMLTAVIVFDGAQRDSDVYFNGDLLGNHESGYTPFHFTLSSKHAVALAQHGSAVLAVRSDCTQPTGWWYDGGGLYRHVSLYLVPSAASVDIWGGAPQYR